MPKMRKVLGMLSGFSPHMFRHVGFLSYHTLSYPIMLFLLSGNSILSGWACFVLGLYDNYNESKRHHDEERLHGDNSSYDFFEMQDDDIKLHYTVTEYCNQNPVSGLRICEKGCL